MGWDRSQLCQLTQRDPAGSLWKMTRPSPLRTSKQPHRWAPGWLHDEVLNLGNGCRLAWILVSATFRNVTICKQSETGSKSFYERFRCKLAGQDSKRFWMLSSCPPQSRYLWSLCWTTWGSKLSQIPGSLDTFHINGSKQKGCRSFLDSRGF